ncbi:MAG: tryptophan--tRNA ligase [Nanoarchaeota archaeon]|nr:tryptophan--tRNA ligase [Nanoarchaeota archaeon]MBU4241685.1 tryptophan--tRNA ligase [Nanoarchaeota archaeon]MBU4351710.1 tryptophan--tRNA ligase [Nanoarchaeota archaeon]MBU4456559.1 tryptophan--tRNA ligase [Nanoarchaeota archaeon]MCG2719934.1 tryptophan--tRNA ligase [Nanoarchaeota archaeon]
MAKVTPWEVSGEIDYDKLITEFGLQPLKDLPKPFNDVLLFRRGIIFAHRDFDKILDAIKKKKPFVMMTGLMPSGKFHLGHKMVADQMIFYQKLGAKVYVTVADIEAYNSRSTDMEELRRVAIEEYLTNYVALGLNLNKCDFYFQSKRSLDGKKSNAYYSLANMLARHATFNEFKAVYGEISPGKMAASLLQASDMLHPQLKEFEGKPLPVVIPVGPDQDPHIRLARDMSQRIKAFNFMQISATYHKFLPGLKGGKMSSSDPMSYIALTDTPEEATRKIKKYAFSGGKSTIEEQRKEGANPKICIILHYLNILFETNDEEIKQRIKDCKTGKNLCGDCKVLLSEKVSKFLKEHQKNREKAKKVVAKFVKDNNF